VDQGSIYLRKPAIGDYRRALPVGILAGMADSRRLEVRLPADLSNAHYAAVVQAVWSVSNVAGLGDTSSQ
jgi:hypothetical protein